jgi:hypothetical protein
MFITKSNKARHLLLKVLAEYDIGKPPGSLVGTTLHFNAICKKLPQYGREFLLDNLDYLHTNKLIYCSEQFDQSNFRILSNGNHAYNEKRFLREGIKDQMNYLYDIVKNISVCILLVIGVWSFVLNFTQTRKNSRMIEHQNQQIKAIQDSLDHLKRSRL